MGSFAVNVPADACARQEGVVRRRDGGRSERASLVQERGETGNALRRVADKQRAARGARGSEHDGCGDGSAAAMMAISHTFAGCLAAARCTPVFYHDRRGSRSRRARRATKRGAGWEREKRECGLRVRVVPVDLRRAAAWRRQRGAPWRGRTGRRQAAGGVRSSCFRGRHPARRRHNALCLAERGDRPGARLASPMEAQLTV
jgi:hypothetical protein